MKYLLDIPRTAMEVFNMLPEGTLCEVIDNTLYMSPSPTTYHQIVLLKIATQISFSCEKNSSGQIFIAPCDVYLDHEQSVVQPDILFVKKDREHLIHKKGIMGAPDLVIEILSTNKVHDQERKLELYQRNNVPEYIIIDPETREVWRYLLTNGVYQTQSNTEAGKLFIHQLNLAISF